MNRQSRSVSRSSASIRPPSPELSSALQQVVQLIRDQQRFLIVGHAKPDGDVMGSSLALYHILCSLGKDVVVFNVDPVPFNFRFLPGSEDMVSCLEPDSPPFDATFLLDCSDPRRVGERFPDAGWGEQLVIIDHHKEVLGAADITVHDASAAASGELMFRLAQELSTELTRPIAECLYCALLTDTGSFRYSSTSPTALLMAGELIARGGIDVWHVTSHVYESNPVERVKLLGKVLQTLDVTPDGRLAVVRISDQIFEEGGRNEAFFDGFINHARSIRGVEVAVQLREVAEEHFQVTFRSSGLVDVGRIAACFQGVGGRHGASCEMQGSWESVRDRLYAALCTLDADAAPAAQQG